MAEKKRLANIEYLRVIAMAMVVVLHFMTKSGSLPEAGSEAAKYLTSQNILALFLESLCIVAVDVYVLISGYLGADREPKPQKAVTFLFRIWFYSLLIPLVLTVFSVPTKAGEQGIYGLVQYFLPIESETYWFATYYLFLLLLMPLCNLAVQHMEKKTFEMIMIFFFIISSLIKSICPVRLPVDRFGYDAMWFVFVYLLGIYLRKYGTAAWEKRGALLYEGSVLLIFFMEFVLQLFSARTGALTYYASVPFHYNFVFCLTGAVGLFYVFLKKPVKEGKKAEVIRFLGRYSFGVYLFHEHPDIRDRWYPLIDRVLDPCGKNGLILWLLKLIVSVVLIYGIGILLDFVRDRIFTFAGNCMRNIREKKGAAR